MTCIKALLKLEFSIDLITMNSYHSSQIILGNAQTDGMLRNGWFIGHFVDDDPVRYSTDVEVKWGVHAAGESRSQ